MPALRIVGTTVHYNYFNHPHDLYEIRSVSTVHLAQLASTVDHPVWSTSASVQRLAEMYSTTHYANGIPTRPIANPKTKGKTPWG